MRKKLEKAMIWFVCAIIFACLFGVANQISKRNSMDIARFDCDRKGGLLIESRLAGYCLEKAGGAGQD